MKYPRYIDVVRWCSTHWRVYWCIVSVIGEQVNRCILSSTQMTCPTSHVLPVGAFLPSIKLDEHSRIHASILFTDQYIDVYKKYGIDRHEMLVLMNAVMCSDVLTGLDKLEYITE